MGLFELDPSQLPASWNTQPGLLPPLGASPDAALVHRLTFMPEDLQAAAALLARHSSSDAGSTSRSSTAAGDSTAAGEAAEAAAVQLLLLRGYDRLACAGKRPAPNGVQYADSSEESVPSSSHSSEADLSDPSPEGDSDTGHNAAPAANSNQHSQAAGGTANLGQSPASVAVGGGVSKSSAVTADSLNGSLSADQAGSLGFEPVAATMLRVLRDWQQQQQLQQQQQPGMVEQSVTVIIREAVEVKNHCPFGVR